MSCVFLSEVRAVDKRLAFIGEHRLFGVIRTDSMETALLAARAAHRGGVRLIEITFTVPEAPQVISILREELATSLIGAGTVLEVEQARAAIRAGAQFIVAPNTNPDVVGMAKDAGVLACPGAATLTEITTAMRLGADMVKVYPAGLLGGPAYLRAVREVLPQARLVPTGGVNAATAPEYLAAGAFAVGMGGTIFPREAMAERDVDAIEAAAREAVAAVSGSK
jgi:2-dehydro-3-deoxyphosphogluconate aldolase/(4S)-4-hydroxy-2-oxoglutarate aldolase